MVEEDGGTASLGKDVAHPANIDCIERNQLIQVTISSKSYSNGSMKFHAKGDTW